MYKDEAVDLITDLTRQVKDGAALGVCLVLDV
jgi:hypothetical protein